MINVYTDGGSRGNPGPSACGFVVYEDGAEIGKGGKFLGLTTNNHAEYFGAIEALRWFDKPSDIDLVLHMDSMLVINQINNVYKVRNRDLMPPHKTVMNLLSEFKSFKAVHVYRESNKEADSMVNEILDQHKENKL